MVRYREEFSRLGGDGLSFDDWGKVEEIDGKIQKDKQYKKLRKAVKSHEAKMIAAEKRLSEAQSAAREKLVKAIGVPESQRLEIRAKTGGKQELDAAVDELGQVPASRYTSCSSRHSAASQNAANFLTSISHKDSENSAADSAIVVSIKPDMWQRSHSRGRFVALGTDAAEATAVHEIGHVLENDSGFAMLATGFLHKRCGNEIPHKMYTNERSGRPEYGREDRFGDAFGDSAGYVGKHYSHGATEIFSMGLEKLYTDPVGFAKKDPEYFNFMVGAMSGKIKIPKDGG
jgi:hypothetical protein